MIFTFDRIRNCYQNLFWILIFLMDLYVLEINDPKKHVYIMSLYPCVCISMCRHYTIKKCRKIYIKLSMVICLWPADYFWNWKYSAERDPWNRNFCIVFLIFLWFCYTLAAHAVTETLHILNRLFVNSWCATT